jgi:hypothetical protein
VAEETKKLVIKHKNKEVTIVMGKPSKAQALDYLEYRERARVGKNTDVTNDGDEQIFACIVSPSSEETRKLFKRYGSLSVSFRDKMEEFIQESSVEGTNAQDLSEELEQKYGENNVAFVVDGKQLVFSIIERPEVKFMEREKAKLGYLPVKVISSWADAHVLPDFKQDYEMICADKPFFSALMGLSLYATTMPTIVEEEKK